MKFCTMNQIFANFEKMHEGFTKDTKDLYTSHPYVRRVRTEGVTRS